MKFLCEKHGLSLIGHSLRLPPRPSPSTCHDGRCPSIASVLLVKTRNQCSDSCCTIAKGEGTECSLFSSLSSPQSTLNVEGENEEDCTAKKQRPLCALSKRHADFPSTPVSLERSEGVSWFASILDECFRRARRWQCDSSSSDAGKADSRLCPNLSGSFEGHSDAQERLRNYSVGNNPSACCYCCGQKGVALVKVREGGTKIQRLGGGGGGGGEEELSIRSCADRMQRNRKEFKSLCAIKHPPGSDSVTSSEGTTYRTQDMTASLQRFGAQVTFVYLLIVLFGCTSGFHFRFFFIAWAVADVVCIALTKSCQRGGICHKAVQTDEHVQAEDEEEDSTGALNAKFNRLQQLLNFVASLRSHPTRRLHSMKMEAATTAATSYGIAELPDECRWGKEGGENSAEDICVEKTRGRKTKGRSKKKAKVEEERGEEEEEEEEEGKGRNGEGDEERGRSTQSE
ncbi:hypothetical protein TcWFU_002981 [Taenia crassiceps]|uniref:Uncharacterized protein n=1 Tax=Taenia crassiceps TaxID=6207 RepID=A0ABR4Q4N1_9CEST